MSTPAATVTTATVASLNMASATTAAAAIPNKPSSVIGPLPASKTFTLTFSPNWSQDSLNTPIRPVSICVLLGPANTLPEQALWAIEFNLYSIDMLNITIKKPVEPVSHKQRAILWYNGEPFPKYKNSIVLSKCRLSANDQLKTQSIVLRTHCEERDPHALIWVPKIAGPKRRRDLSYFKVVTGHQYNLNITFGAGSNIAQLLDSEKWRPIVYLYAKRQRGGIDEIQSSRLFTNFTTEWAKDTEPNVSEVELISSKEVQRREAEEDAEYEEQRKKDLYTTTYYYNDVKSSPTGPLVMFDDVKSPSSTTSPTSFPAEGDCRTGASLPDLTNESLESAASGLGTGYFAAPIISSIAKGFAEKAAKYQNPLPPMTRHLDPLPSSKDIPMTWEEVETAILSSTLTSIVLPSLDDKSFNPDFPLDPIVLRFVGQESTLAQALCVIEGAARTMSNDSKSPHSDTAKHLLNTFSFLSQLPYFLHVQNFMHNPRLYIEQTRATQKANKNIANAATTTTTTTATTTAIAATAIAASAVAKTAVTESSDDVQTKGIWLLRRLCQRVEWLLDLQRKANAQFNAEFYVKAVATDRAWVEDASSFIKETETKVTVMLTENPEKFRAFRELLRKGLQWPHSPALRTEIERAGFVFRPTMFQRDHCICEACGVEVFGWRPWHNPWSFHNYAKHPPSFQPGIAVTLQPPTSQFVAQMITESNKRRGAAKTTPNK